MDEITSKIDFGLSLNPNVTMMKCVCGNWIPYNIGSYGMGYVTCKECGRQFYLSIKVALFRDAEE